MPTPLNALVIDNGLGAEKAYRDTDVVRFTTARTGPGFDPRLEDYELLVVPNGCDHVAMHRIRDKVRDFLHAGKALFCFDGWVTDWIPGHRWRHENSKPTRELRHIAGDDSLGLLRGVHVPAMDENAHGIIGWWYCGYIEPAPQAEVLIRDPFGRAVVVADDRSTPGFIFLTASGPLGDYGDGASPHARLYHNLLDYPVKSHRGCTAQPTSPERNTQPSESFITRHA